ncbi:MAG: CD225/dispanin family protein [Fibrobacterota bacterium]|nr:CD225/dispanin family protein [Fibrobacterota bacterium]QQS06433.1 MAG: CD225/dispanin family protein [Fibrobacterota bacterium]
MICPKCGSLNDDGAIRCIECKEVLRLDVSGNEEVPNYMVQSVLVTLFCCMPLGVMAIVSATKANELAKKGEVDEALAAADKAKTYLRMSFGVGLVFTLIYAAMQFAQ